MQRPVIIKQLISYACVMAGVLLMTAIQSCDKNNPESAVPSVPVNLRINLDDPMNSQLNTIGGSIQVEGGYRGIIIYRLTNTEYKAYDRTCTYQSENTCAIVAIDSAISSVGCNCCKSRFQLLDGSPISGPASFGLRTFYTSLQGRDLYIYN